jgi:hypothetical protein
VESAVLSKLGRYNFLPVGMRMNSVKNALASNGINGHKYGE